MSVLTLRLRSYILSSFPSGKRYGYNHDSHDARAIPERTDSTGSQFAIRHRIYAWSAHSAFVDVGGERRSAAGVRQRPICRGFESSDRSGPTYSHRALVAVTSGRDPDYHRGR